LKGLNSSFELEKMRYKGKTWPKAPT